MKSSTRILIIIIAALSVVALTLAWITYRGQTADEARQVLAEQGPAAEAASPESLLARLQGASAVSVNPSEVRGAVMTALRGGDITTARALLEALKMPPEAHPDLGFAWANLLLVTKEDIDRAKTLLHATLRQQPSDVEARRLLCAVLLDSPRALERNMAKSLLRGLAEDAASFPIWTRALVRCQDLFFEGEAADLAALVQGHPQYPEWLEQADPEELDSVGVALAGLEVWVPASDILIALCNRAQPPREAFLNALVTSARAGKLDRVRELLPRFEEAYLSEGVAVRYFSLLTELAITADPGHLDRLRRLAKEVGNPEAYVQALDFVRQFMEFRPAMQRAIAEIGLSMEGMDPAAVVILANTALEDDPGKLERVAPMVMKALADYPSQLVTWLRLQGMRDAALDLARTEVETGDTLLLSPLAEMLIETGQLEAAEEIINQRGADLGWYLQGLLRMRLDEERTGGAELSALWDGLWEQARSARDVRQMVGLAQIAFGRDDLDRLFTAYRELVNYSVLLPRGDLARLAGDQFAAGNLAAAHQVMKEATLFYPDDLEFINNRIYLELLLEGSSADRISQMEAVHAAAPDSTPFTFTLALAYLLADFGEDALRVINTIEPDFSKLPASSTAIYAAVQKAAGDASQADLIFSFVKPEKLLPEERRVLLGFASGSR